MKKIFLFLFFLFFALPVHAVTYYACGTANIDGASEWNTAAACDGTAKTYGTDGFPESGAVLEANTYTVTINTNPGPNGIVTLQNTAGGGFTVGTSVTPLTITASGTASGAALLVLTGNANANPALTIAGDTTWTGGNGSNEYAISDSHTVGTVVLGSSGHPVAIVGGSNSSAYGYYTATVSPVSGYANSTGASAAGFFINGAVGDTLIGNCIGSNTSPSAPGCFASNSNSYLVFTGNIINGTKAVGAQGAIRLTLTEPSSGVTGNYVKFDGGGTAVYIGTNTDDATKALNTFYYIDPTDGGSDVGTATVGGGGGAWSF